VNHDNQQLPQVQALLVGRELQAALDTRASANFINGRIIKPQTRRRTTVQLAGEDSTIPSTGSATLEVSIGDQTYIEEFLVVDQLSVDVILGDPWLRHAHVTLDYGLRCAHHGTTQRSTTYWTGRRLPPTGVIPSPQVQHGFPADLTNAFMDVLETFRSVSDHANCIGAVRAVTHTIRLKKDEPFRLRPYPVSDKKKKQLFQCVQEMLAAGVIERSVSDYCSPAVLVTKKDGTVRFCTDYRKLNLLTEDEAAPLPKISDALREFGSATVFSAIDLKSGYWQIPMDKASKHLTAFATPDGATYQYRVMPFGLKNAPATFQKLMTRVLEGHLGKFAHVYLDDIIIFSRDHREHLVHLRLILERLQEYGLRCATEKCRFGVTELPYLGHIVGGNHNRPQPKHLEQIRSAPTPTTRKQLQSFLGLANWVRDYVPRFAELAAPITDLLNKKSRYRWTEEAQQAFEALKEAMSRPLHLHRPDPRKRFFLQTDASGVGIAAVLYQEEEDRRQVISHASAKLNQTQQKYHINEQECLAIVWAVRRYRAYLEDQEFTLRTDNKALLWLNTAKNSNAKLTRWALLLQEFKFQVEHCPGKSNQLPDLLSRDPTGPELTEEAESVDRMFFPWTGTTEAANNTTTTTLAAAEVVTLADEIKLAQQQDPEFPGIVRRLETIAETGPEEPGDAAFARHYEIRDGHLWLRAEPPLLWVPPAARARVLHEFHDSPDAGHPGREETIRAIRTQYTWPTLSKDADQHLRACLICATTKRGPIQARAPRRAYIPKRPWQTIAIDYMGPYEETPSGNQFLLVVTDIFSKWVEAFPIRRATAKATVRALENEVFCRWGYPSAIISDNGTQFTSEEFRRACRRWKTRHWPTAIYHPQANPAERRNQELKKLMRILTQEPTPKPWDETIPKGLFNLRKRRNAATGQSPSELLLGFEITRPGQWDMNNQAVQTTAEERQQLAEENLARYRRRYDERNRQPPTYEIGDQVLVRRHTPPGLRSRWIGPLSITGITGENCYKIDRGTSETVEHVDNIRPAPKIQRHRQRGVGTQVEPGDEHPIQVTVGRIDEGDQTEFDNATLHRIRARQQERRQERRRGQEASTSQPDAPPESRTTTPEPEQRSESPTNPEGGFG
jgi:transposase InsO family protein